MRLMTARAPKRLGGHVTFISSAQHPGVQGEERQIFGFFRCYGFANWGTLKGEREKVQDVGDREKWCLSL